MRNVLVVGMQKTGTTIVASVIRNSIPGALLYMEPARVAFFEKHARSGVPLVVKIIYEHWMRRPFLLTGIVRGETGFRPDKAVAIVRDPRDGLISALMYSAYEHVLQGATREQVDEWVEIVRQKEARPDRHSLVGLIGDLGRIFDVRLEPDSFFDAFVDYTAWVAANGDHCHVLRYEDFVAGRTAGLSAYLGTALPSSREVDPALRRVARTGAAGDWHRMMLPEDVARWKERYRAALEPYGYGEWDIRPERTDPTVGSEYIRRITDEAFGSLRSNPAEPRDRPARG